MAIFCEGRTEEKILNALRAHWHVPHAQVHLVGGQGVPRTVVDAARAHQRANAKDQPVIVVVFDRDEHRCWSEAIDTAIARNFVVAVSNPCVELWGLLLHRDQSADIHRHVVQRQLRDVHPRYHHEDHPYFDLETVLRHLDDAAARAAVLSARAEAAGDRFGCPTTGFHAAVEAVRPPVRVDRPAAPARPGVRSR